MILFGGRVVRRTLLIGPDGRWRDEMWLDSVVLPPAENEPPEKERKPVLTGPLPINACSTDSLCLLPGVGPVLAGRIDEARRSGAVFHTPKDLQAVKGIGPALSAKLAPHVVFEIPAGAVTVPETSDPTPVDVSPVPHRK